MTPDPETVRARLKMVDEMYELGIRMKRNVLRRRHPEASEEEIDRLWREWLASPPEPSEGTTNIRRTSPHERFP